MTHACPGYIYSLNLQQLTGTHPGQVTAASDMKRFAPVIYSPLGDADPA